MVSVAVEATFLPRGSVVMAVVMPSAVSVPDNAAQHPSVLHGRKGAALGQRCDMTPGDALCPVT